MDGNIINEERITVSHLVLKLMYNYTTYAITYCL